MGSQEERQRTKHERGGSGGDTGEVESSTSGTHFDMAVERILEAEKRVECKLEQPVEFEVNFFFPNFIR